VTTAISLVGSTDDALQPLLVTGYMSTREGQNVFHTVLGTQELDVSLNPYGLRSGTIEYLCATEDDSVAVENLHSMGVIQVSDDDRASIAMSYVVSGSVTRSLDDESRDLWLVAVNFQEVSP
jgi:hypothetical protein